MIDWDSKAERPIAVFSEKKSRIITEILTQHLG